MQLINSHLVININKEGIVLIPALAGSRCVCLENIRNDPFSFKPLVSKGTSSIYQVAFKATVLKRYKLFKQHHILWLVVAATNHTLFQALGSLPQLTATMF